LAAAGVSSNTRPYLEASAMSRASALKFYLRLRAKWSATSFVAVVQLDRNVGGVFAFVDEFL